MFSIVIVVNSTFRLPLNIARPLTISSAATFPHDVPTVSDKCQQVNFGHYPTKMPGQGKTGLKYDVCLLRFQKLVMGDI